MYTLAPDRCHRGDNGEAQPAGLGIVGCGYAAEHLHLPAKRSLPALKVVAIAETDPERLRSVGERFAIARRYHDYEALLRDDKVDAVGVCVPPRANAMVVLAALDARKHVLVEKSLCLDLDEADLLVESAGRTSVTAKVGFNLWPAWEPPRIALSVRWFRSHSGHDVRGRSRAPRHDLAASSSRDAGHDRDGGPGRVLSRGLSCLMAAFAECALPGAPAECAFDDGRRALELVVAALDSIRSGHPTDLTRRRRRHEGSEPPTMSGGAMDFSIIIPTYNRPVQLGQCLGALTRLEYPRDRFEVIIVDDGSTMSVAEVVASFYGRLDLTVRSAPHAGPSHARNFGAEHARGRHLAFTDDDCMATPGWLHALDVRASGAPGAIVGGQTLNALPENLCSTLSHLVVEAAYAYYNADPDHARFFASNNLTVPAGPFRELGGFDPEFTTAEDRDLCARWTESGGRLVYAPEAVVYHAHALTIAGLWRQHFAYGRGAYRFHRTHDRWRGFAIDPRFYRELLVRPYARERAQRATLLTALLAVQQSANTAGFLAEMLVGRV
ncbi:MAG: Gfo/Idh/MocA family oxidoreductase [Casimicrobiaceae bacterium]